MSIEEKLAHLKILAEEKLAQQGPLEESPEDPASVLHNLRVHQAELELQNEELRETQIELSRSRDRFLELFHHAPVGYIVLDQAGIMSRANAKLGHLLGVDSSTLRGSALADWIQEDDRKVYLARYNAWINDPENKFLDVTMCPAKGEAFYARLQARFVPEKGREQLLVTITDTTSTVVARQQLNQALEEQHAILETSLVGIVFLKNRIITQINPRLCQMLGYSADELVGSSPEMVHLSHEAFEEFGEQHYKRLANQEVVELEYPLRHKEGHVLWCLFNGKALHAPDLSLGAVWAIHDITKRRQMVEDLKNAQTMWRLTFDASPDLISVVDKDFRITMANQSMSTYLQRSQDQLIGKKCFELFGHKDVCPVCPHEKVLQDGHLHVGEVTFTQPPGVFRISGAQYLEEEKQLVWTVQVANDLTRILQMQQERTEMEHQLHQSHKLEAMGVLAGGLAHDFNNILQTISGNAELAKEEGHRSLECTNYLNEILEATRHAADICTQMLTFSGHQQPGRPKPIRLASFLHDLHSLVLNAIPRNVTLTVHAEDRDLCVMANEVILKQLLLNLVINGAEACGHSAGSIEVTLTSRNLKEELIQTYQGHVLQPGPHIAILVKDTGSGMSPDTLTRIFDPFFSTKFTGRGLGLATVLGAVKSLHGGLQVESEQGVGTTFTLLFPKCPPTAKPDVRAPNTQPAHEPNSKGHLLVVDDEPTLLRTLKTGLERYGYVVTTAESARKALAHMRDTKDIFAAVICDITMPHMTGEELLIQIRKQHPLLPVILTSGYSQEEIGTRITSDPYTKFLHKPFRLHELKNILGLVEKA